MVVVAVTDNQAVNFAYTLMVKKGQHHRFADIAVSGKLGAGIKNQDMLGCLHYGGQTLADIK